MNGTDWEPASQIPPDDGLIATYHLVEYSDEVLREGVAAVLVDTTLRLIVINGVLMFIMSILPGDSIGWYYFAFIGAVVTLMGLDGLLRAQRLRSRIRHP